MMNVILICKIVLQMVLIVLRSKNVSILKMKKDV